MFMLHFECSIRLVDRRSWKYIIDSRGECSEFMKFELINELIGEYIYRLLYIF